MRILFTGGGSGGHQYPIIAVLREIQRIAEEERILNLEFFYIGPDDFGGDFLKGLRQEGVLPVKIRCGKWRQYFSLANFFDVFNVAIGVLQAIWNMYLILPDIIFSKGGYGAFPAVFAAKIFRIPVVMHESDAIPGKVSLYTAKFAKRIGVAFQHAIAFFPKEKTALIGVPIRKRLLGGNIAEAKEELNIYSNFPVVGVIGASQGSQKINDAITDVLKELTTEFEVVHQTGAANLEGIKQESQVIFEFGHKERYHPFGFLDEATLREFYTASDLIVARAGASTIYEIAAWGKPSILIPLANAAQDHQRKNAYDYAATGAAIVVEEANLTPHILLAEIRKILGDPEHIKKMKEAAQKFSRIDAAELIAREILKLGLHGIMPSDAEQQPSVPPPPLQMPKPTASPLIPPKPPIS